MPTLRLTGVPGSSGIREPASADAGEVGSVPRPLPAEGQPARGDQKLVAGGALRVLTERLLALLPRGALCRVLWGQSRRRVEAQASQERPSAGEVREAGGGHWGGRRVEGPCRGLDPGGRGEGAAAVCGPLPPRWRCPGGSSAGPSERLRLSGHLGSPCLARCVHECTWRFPVELCAGSGSGVGARSVLGTTARLPQPQAGSAAGARSFSRAWQRGRQFRSFL